VIGRTDPAPRIRTSRPASPQWTPRSERLASKLNSEWRARECRLCNKTYCWGEALLRPGPKAIGRIATTTANRSLHAGDHSQHRRTPTMKWAVW
jgi:hypothetical protein